MYRLLAASCSAVILFMPVIGNTADIGNPAFATPGAPSGKNINTSDRIFVLGAAAGGTAEVDLGRLAGDSAGSDAVKNFARHMIEAHAKANEQLSALAGKFGITAPKEPDADHKAIRARLDKMTGTEFDFAYLNSQLSDHQKAVQLFAYEATAGQNEELKQFAAETLPVIMRHLRETGEIRAQEFGIQLSTLSE
jgi:putative membrane protein